MASRKIAFGPDDGTRMPCPECGKKTVCEKCWRDIHFPTSGRGNAVKYEVTCDGCAKTVDIYSMKTVETFFYNDKGVAMKHITECLPCYKLRMKEEKS